MNKIREENLGFEERKGRGRPPGALNKATKTFTEVAEGSVEKELKADPKAALTLLAQMAEYATPKLNRTEVTGDGGGPVEVSAIQIKLVKPNES
jgi:hypothetical protein